MCLPAGAEACDLSASSSWLVGSLHSCYGRFMRTDPSKEPSRAWAGSLIPGAGAPEIVEQNKWMNNPSNEERAQAGHRDQLSTALTRRRRRRGRAAYTPCWSRDTQRLITIWKREQIKDLPTLANKRRVPTEVRELLFPELFPSANIATALFCSTSLVLFTVFFCLFLLFCPEKQSLLSS